MPAARNRRAAKAPRSRTVRKRAARPGPLPPIVPGSVPEDRDGILVARIDPPHLMEVCRGCGRIAPLSLAPEEMVVLDRFSARAPAGWSVDGISLTLTGTCRKCREGPEG